MKQVQKTRGKRFCLWSILVLVVLLLLHVPFGRSGATRYVSDLLENPEYQPLCQVLQSQLEESNTGLTLADLGDVTVYVVPKRTLLGNETEQVFLPYIFPELQNVPGAGTADWTVRLCAVTATSRDGVWQPEGTVSFQSSEVTLTAGDNTVIVGHPDVDAEERNVLRQELEPSAYKETGEFRINCQAATKMSGGVSCQELDASVLWEGTVRLRSGWNWTTLEFSAAEARLPYINHI